MTAISKLDLLNNVIYHNIAQVCIWQYKAAIYYKHLR